MLRICVENFEWKILSEFEIENVPVAPYLCTNVVNRMDELVDGRKEGCKLAENCLTFENKVSNCIKIKF